MSELGYYNFKYPDKESTGRFVKDVDVKVLSYIGGGDFIAIETESENLDPGDFNSSTSAVVWVRPKDLA